MLSTRVVQRRALRVAGQDAPIRKFALQLRVEPVSGVGALMIQNWSIMQLLATSGANLSQPDAAPLAADLMRTVVPGAGRFVGLK